MCVNVCVCRIDFLPIYECECVSVKTQSRQNRGGAHTKKNKTDPPPSSPPNPLIPPTFVHTTFGSRALASSGDRYLKSATPLANARRRIACFVLLRVGVSFRLGKKGGGEGRGMRGHCCPLCTFYTWNNYTKRHFFLLTSRRCVSSSPAAAALPLPLLPPPPVATIIFPHLFISNVQHRGERREGVRETGG